MKSSIYIGALAIIIMSCQKGPEGEIGPAGAKGASGNAGVNNTTAGPQGSKGATGDQGATGPKGTTGASGADGVSNLIITDWKKVVWRHLSTNGTSNVFVGEIAVPEITQTVIDRGLVRTYLRVNGRSTANDEFPEGVSITISGGGNDFRMVNNGISLGKMSLVHASTSTQAKETIANNLNALSTEIRASIIIVK